MTKESHKGIFKNKRGFSKPDDHVENVDLTIIREPFHTYQMSLSVYTSHEVVVQTGMDIPLEDVMAFVAHHKRFVLNRLRTYQGARKAEGSISLFANGEVIKMFNGPYTIERSATESWLRISGNKIIIPEKARQYSSLNYDIRRIAMRELTALTEAYAELYGFHYSSIYINERKTAWGDCDSHKRIGFNVSLAFLPEPLVEYVVVHELAHTREMNHGRNFWLEVRRVLSDYEERRKNSRDTTSIGISTASPKI